MISVLSALLAVTLLGVPTPPGPYSWVCGYLDSAPTLFGVLGLPAEAERNGVVVDTDAITEVVAADCPEHTELLGSLTLVVGG